MKNFEHRNAGYYLLLGSFLMIVTMVLHPVGGGGFERLIANSTFGIIAHSIAILSVPISILGFIGLNSFFGKDRFLSKLSLAVMVTGLVAAALAATVNGLAQPIFALGYKDASSEVIDSIGPIFNYNMALNHAFDYILIASMFLTVFLWSLVILQTKKMSPWIGWIGFALVGVAVILVIQGFYFLDLHGFRIFVFGWVIWIILVAIALVRSENQQAIG